MADVATPADPQSAGELRDCARHLLMHPLTLAERNPEEFRLIRRHHHRLDQWFTQRLGYRLHVDADTARLHKSGVIAWSRPLRAHTNRPMHRRELQVLALVLAACAAGPLVISLRDLVEDVRSAATEVGAAFGNDIGDRRALVTAMRWMVEAGLLVELHDHVDRYADDDEADAVLRVRPDRIALLPVAGLLGEPDAASLLQRADRREPFRQWARCRLIEDPVLYREDLSPEEWGELRRRLGEERDILDEMFGLSLEVRADIAWRAMPWRCWPSTGSSTMTGRVRSRCGLSRHVSR